jgi:IS30 family transposase
MGLHARIWFTAAQKAELWERWNAIALRLNQRPRKTLGFETPADRLQAVLH